jgi:hypothetical protein
MQTPTCITLSAVSLTTIPVMIHKGLPGLQDGRDVGVWMDLFLLYDKSDRISKIGKSDKFV